MFLDSSFKFDRMSQAASLNSWVHLKANCTVFELYYMQSVVSCWHSFYARFSFSSFLAFAAFWSCFRGRI